MFGIDIKAIAKTEVNKIEADLMKIDLNHNGISDVTEIKKEIDEICEGVKFLENKITPAEAFAALNVLFPDKFNAEEVAKIEKAITGLIALEPKIEALAAEAKKVVGI